MKINLHTNNILSKLGKTFSRFLGGAKIALDLGTSNTRIGIYEKGVVLREPTYIGLNTKTNEYLFYGQEAKEISGKAPNFINVIKPIQNSIISDFDASVLLVKYFLEKSVYPFYFKKSFLKSKLTAYTVIPTSSTEVEQKAVQESLIKAGLSEVFLIEKPIAAALGAKLSPFSNQPIFIVDTGGGLIEIAVIIMGGIVACKTLKNAGEHMDKLIYNYINLKYGVIIGEQTAENLKINLFNLVENERIVAIRGKSLENSLPKSIRVKSSDIKEALANNINQIIDAVAELIESIPPEIIDGIIKNGITLTGNLAQIAGIDKFITNDLKIPVFIPENPQDAVVTGILKLIGNREQLQKVLIK